MATYVEITAGRRQAEELGPAVNVRPDGSASRLHGKSPPGGREKPTSGDDGLRELGYRSRGSHVVHGDKDLVRRGGRHRRSRSRSSVEQGGAPRAPSRRSRRRAIAADLFEAADGRHKLDKDRGGFHVAGSRTRFGRGRRSHRAPTAEHVSSWTRLPGQGREFVRCTRRGRQRSTSTRQGHAVADVTSNDAGPGHQPVIVEGNDMEAFAQGARTGVVRRVL